MNTPCRLYSARMNCIRIFSDHHLQHLRCCENSGKHIAIRCGFSPDSRDIRSVPGRNGTHMHESKEPLLRSSVQIVFKAVLKESGIYKNTSVHTLRHSGVYPTRAFCGTMHLLEKNVNSVALGTGNPIKIIIRSVDHRACIYGR